MSIQLQLRRGTTEEQNAFIGAEGEITYDTQEKTLRIHDGVTAGGVKVATFNPNIAIDSDYVIVSQKPTAGNNYTWFRKYKSGWVEQGGFIPFASTGGWTNGDVTLPIEMENNFYQIYVKGNWSDPASSSATVNTVSTTGFNVKVAINILPDRCGAWLVCGYSAVA